MSDRRLRLAERKLVDFFKNNPDEELTVDDAIAKFDLPRTSAMKYLAALSGDGLLERVSVYKLSSKVQA